MQEVSTASYWIASNALYITLNANGAPNYILGNTASGAHILCYVKGVDGLEYDAAHNYRRWPLSLTPTKFNTNTEKYVYVAIPRPTNPETTAVVVFPSEKLDLYGKNEAGRQIGSELYYYVWLRGIITATNAGETLERAWQQRIETGTLNSDEAIDAGGDQTWWRYSSVDDTVTFLKEIVMDAKSVFHNLKARILVLAGHELTGVATAETSEEFVDSETLVVTPNYLRKMTEDKFLRKDQDDATPYSLTVGGNLSVGGILRAVTGYFTSLYSNLVQSTNYTGEGIADTGYRLTADDGTGSSALTVDNLHVRKKATFEELEVKKETSVAGNEIRSAAANVINRTDYIDQNGEVIGYSYHTVPWMLRKMPFLLRHRFFGRLRRVRITIDPEHVGDIKKIRCYFLAKDGDRDVKNLWRAHDLVRCQTFNISRSNRFTYIGQASQSKFGNVYWWRKAVLVSTSPVAIDDKEYHYFDVSMDDCTANSDIPCAGDHAVQFGNDSDEERMNLIIQEVNGTDAPAIKAYTGIYTYDLNKCWWGGSPRKMMLSPKSGYEFYGPSFKFVQEYGQAPASIDRGAWSEIPTERDDYEPHAQVRKCYYYDKVSHNGCYWLCVMSQVGAHWVDASGNYLTQAQYDALPADQKLLCTRRQNYVTSQPGTDDTAWKKLVNKGDNMIRLDIDNEMDTVQTDSTGKVTAQRTVTTVVRLYDGSSEVAIGNPTVTGIAYTDTDGHQQTLQPTITASGNGRQLSWTFQTGWTLQGRYQVSIGYTYQNVPYTAVFTLTASQGLAIFQLKPAMSAIPFQRDADGNLTPASKSLALDIIKIDGASTATITPATYGRTKIRYSLTEMPTLVTSGTAWPSTGSISVPNTAENVYIALFNIYDGLIDRESVPVIKDGEKGTSITKASADTYRYAIGDSGIIPPTSGWSSTKPSTFDKNKWLWTETTIHWSDNTTTVLYSAERNPNDGIAGQDIIVDGATEMKYYVGDSNTTHPAEDSSDWKDLSQVTQTQGKWLWSKATTWYRKASSAAGSKDAGHSVNYNVSYISKDGKTGRGIQSITEYYQATNSSASRQAPTSESGWDTDPNLSHLTDKWNQSHKYLWNMEKTVYSNVDGSTTTEYSIPQILAIWTKDGDAGRGIDSIVNYYKVTSSSTAPSKPATPGTDGWSTTPTAPGQGQYLWNYERITWVNPSSTTETDVQMIGYAGTNGRTPQKGVDYTDGKDAVNVSLSPEEVIVTQATSAPYGIDLSNAETVVSVNEGGVPKSFTISNVSGTHCQAAVKSGTTDTIKISQIDTYNVTVDGETVARYYDNGYVTFYVTYGSNTYRKRFNFYANLLGTWKETVEAGVKDVVAEVVTYDFLDGKLTKNNRTYTQTASAAGNYETWSSEENTQEGSKKWMNQHINTADQNISRLESRSDSRNMLDCASGDGWRLWNDDSEATYNNTTQKIGNNSEIDAYSTAVFLKAGTYTVSLYAPVEPAINIYKCNKNPNATNEQLGTAISVDVAEWQETYQGCKRYYGQFEVTDDDYYKVDVFTNSSTLNYFFRPQLEVGAITDWVPGSKKNSSSQIRQTADEIEAKVNNTGVNISTGEVTVFGGKFSMKPNKSSAATFELDSNGNLVSKGSAQFEGKVKATSGEFTGKVTSGEGEIGGFTITSNEIKSVVAANKSLTLNKDGSFTVINGTNSVKMNTDGFEVMFGGEGFRVGNFGTGHQGMERWDSIRNVWAPMYERKIAKVFKATSINLGSTENKSVNYVLNARVNWDNRTVVYLPNSTNVPNGTSIIVRGLARDCDSDVVPAQNSGDVILVGDYKVSSVGVLAADCAEFILCKDVNTYIRAYAQEENPSVYVVDAWLCNMYDRDV